MAYVRDPWTFIILARRCGSNAPAHSLAGAWIEASDTRLSMVYLDDSLDHVLEAYMSLKEGQFRG